MTKTQKHVVKVTVGTIVSSIVLFGALKLFGYEEADLLAFAILIGLSVAALK